MAVCMERKPPGKVYASKDEALTAVQREYHIHKNHEKLAKELFYQTIRDALAYISNNSNRFKPFRGKIRNGTGKFDPEKAHKKAYADIQEWIGSEDFRRITIRLRLDPDEARQAVVDILEGKSVEDVEDYVNKLLHSGRVYELRGPKPREQ